MCQVSGQNVQGALYLLRWVHASFLSVATKVVRVLRVRAPASVTEPKLTLRAMTEGLKSRSAKLFSAGTLLSSDQ